jgi:hypothetical protein
MTTAIAARQAAQDYGENAPSSKRTLALSLWARKHTVQSRCQLGRLSALVSKRSKIHQGSRIHKGKKEEFRR